MRRPAFYSSSRPGQPAAGSSDDEASAAPPESTRAASRSRRIRRPSSTELLWVAVLVMAMLLAWSFAERPAQRRITQEDINAAVLKTLETQQIPSEYTRAYEAIRPSVVRVVSYVKQDRVSGELAAKLRKRTDKPKPLGPAQGEPQAEDGTIESGVGTGVVIVDKGIILTNLHVVAGADRIKVTFHDGLEATATLVNVQPENDLAVLQASKIPDDMIAATMRSTADLLPGDKVMAVGFPFGIGPSGSAGVVSGLKRVFRSPDGGQELGNLIQFDAAANPGNSGGPLVTMDGELVGIVTAILNPTSARTFLGIGFAVPIENAAQAAGLPPF
ncbi:trypsin-like peptidase domain-containing protein [Ramlibacter sp. AN1015]|uniref:S1C family serine protease n=1 Tax=Ramlibacter sp. AN1015 TaxID=3133428 RepID=UPI0030C5D3C4